MQTDTDPSHFTQAVTEFGSVRPVVTTQAIYNAKGVKIIEQGVAIHPGLYERLMEHRLSAPIEDSVASQPTVNGPVLRRGVETLASQSRLFGRMLQDRETRELLLDVVERIHLPEPIAFQLTMAKDIRPALYEHLLSTTLIAAWLAVSSSMNRLELRVAATAGLLHDLGMLHLDPQLLDPKSGIDRAQHRQLVTHPLVSSALIERHKEYPREVVQAVLEHHEFLDGSGYPRNLPGASLSACGKVMALTELVAGAFAPGREVPELRLSILLRMNTHRYDENLIEKILGLLKPQDESVAALTLLDDPVACLLDLEKVVTSWPQEQFATATLQDEHKKVLLMLASQVAQLHRNLAGVGATREQLQQLGQDALELNLRAELTLLASEAAWQLRAMARRIRRRWRTEADTATELALQGWLSSVDAAVSRTTREFSADDA